MKNLFKLKNLIYSVILIPLFFSVAPYQTNSIEKSSDSKSFLSIFSIEELVGQKYPNYNENYYIEQIAIGEGHANDQTSDGGHSGAVVSDGTTDLLFTWGLNDQGQLGLGDKKYYDTPQLVTFPISGSYQIEQISMGYAHSMAIVNSGGEDYLYTWGADSYGQLGQGVGDNGTQKPIRISDASMTNGEIESISAKEFQSSAIVTNDAGDSELYTWGKNDQGQLGYNTVGGESYSSPKQVSFPSTQANGKETIEQVSMGDQHTAAIINDENGDHLYTWGKNDYGQLGLGEEANNKYDTPQEVTEGLPDGGDIEQISMGGTHSAAIIDSQLYTWGRNDKDQLGTKEKPANQPQVNSPVLATSLNEGDVKQISMGKKYSTAIKTNSEGKDELFAWGDNAKGQTGVSGAGSVVADPTTVSFGSANKEVKQIVTADDYSMAIVTDGEKDYLYVWGENAAGQLGLGNEITDEVISKPTTNYSFNSTYLPEGPFTSQWYFYLIIAIAALFIIAVIVIGILIFLKKRIVVS